MTSDEMEALHEILTDRDRNTEYYRKAAQDALAKQEKFPPAMVCPACHKTVVLSHGRISVSDLDD